MVTCMHTHARIRMHVRRVCVFASLLVVTDAPDHHLGGLGRTRAHVHMHACARTDAPDHHLGDWVEGELRWLASEHVSYAGEYVSRRHRREVDREGEEGNGRRRRLAWA